MNDNHVAATVAKATPLSADRQSGAAEAHGAKTTRSAWLAHMKQDLLAPVGSVLERTAILIKDVGDRGHPQLVADLQKVHVSAEQLRALIEKLLDPAQPPVPDESLTSKDRHELRNPLTHIIGYCELWIDAAEELLLEGFVPDLKEIHTLGRTMLARLDELFIFAKGGGQQDIPKTFQDFFKSMPPRPVRSPLAGTANTATILVADDNEINRDLLCRMLTHDEHTVTAVADGKKALELLRARRFDLVLLDVIMPEVNGLQILEQLKADVNLCQVPVIMVSAFDDLDCVARCIQIGAEDYLPKPINAVLLKARIDACLEKKRLHQRELEQFFPAEIVGQLLCQPDLLRQGQKVDVSVLFCDIRGFSRVSERLSAGETMRWLSAVMECLSECVFRQQGVLVDFIGDELMAFWGAPQPQPDHARRACAAALDMVGQLPRLNEEWRRVTRSEMSLGIGVNSGPAHVGNTGIRRRFKYGPHGNVVNLASRVQGATKFLKSKLLITGATRQYLDDSFALRRLATIAAVNIATPLDLYELVPDDQPGWPQVRHDYEQALEFFESQKLKEAAELLSKLITDHGAQGPELSLMSRTMDCLVEPSRWKKVWELPGK
jgi:adenylate cyclase